MKMNINRKKKGRCLNEQEQEQRREIKNEEGEIFRWVRMNIKLKRELTEEGKGYG